MEDDEDDFYGGDGNQQEFDDSVPIATNDDGVQPKTEMSEDEDEEEDSDDDVQFTLEKPEGVKTEPQSSRASTRQPDKAIPIESAKATRSASTSIKPEAQRSVSAVPPPTQAIKGVLTYDGKEGKDFPEIHTSNIDVNAIPKWPANGKEIIEVDIDADLAEHAKPWRLPGTDQTDFFNYGFDEYTWTQYCVRQQTMSTTISEQRQADAQMKAFFGGGAGGPGAGQPTGVPPPMPGGMPGMGMPDPQQLMEMVNQGVIPQEFAQQMMQQMGGGMPGFPGGGGFGQEQNSNSPLPQPGQGFQPPQGLNGNGQQGGFGGNMEGYSAQQMAIMQQQDQQGGGGGGGRGRNRRGRGFY